MKEFYSIIDKYESDEEKFRELFREKMQIKEEKGRKEQDYISSINKRYIDRFGKINQEVAANELFLSSILIEKAKAAKAFWKRGKVRFF